MNIDKQNRSRYEYTATFYKSIKFKDNFFMYKQNITWEW